MKRGIAVILIFVAVSVLSFVGYNAWVGTAGGISAVQVTEWEEPQAVIGSYLHRYAYPDYFKRHQENQRRLQHAQEHAGGAAQCLQLRGEYVYAAEGRRGLQIYDAANVGNKDYSQSIVAGGTLATSDASCVALPTTPPRSSSRARRSPTAARCLR